MVIALDKRKRPLGFMTERRARKLMERKRAVLYRAFPATVVVKDVDAGKLDSLPSYRVKVDPGAGHTGIAVVCNETEEAVLYLQVHHRGHKVSEGSRTIRRQRYAIRPGALFLLDGKRLTSSGVQQYGKYVTYRDGSGKTISVAVKKITVVHQPGGWKLI